MGPIVTNVMPSGLGRVLCLHYPGVSLHIMDNMEEIQMLRRKVAALELQNEALTLKLHLQTGALSSRWGLVHGSSWELKRDTSTTQSSVSTLSRAHASNALEDVASALRQIKYEFYCAAFDLFGFTLYVGPNRNCTVESIYKVDGETLQLEFIYSQVERRYTDVAWTERMHDFIQPYRFWVLDKHCIPGFLSQVFLHLYERQGSLPTRARHE